MEGPRDDVFEEPNDDRRSLGRESAPGLARLAAGAMVRTNLWTMETAYRVTRRVAAAAMSGESAVNLVGEARDELAGAARRILGVADVELPQQASRSGDEPDPLRRRWEDLVERSTEVTDGAEAHPAFADILDHLHPDEARILRLLATSGPQAAVDVRTWRPLGIGSHVVAPGLTMIGRHAGCLHVDRVPAYLSNLFRLGLIWFSRDPIDELAPYQVLEAQPAVTQALKDCGRGTTVRRSIRLTPFGVQFCSAALPEGTVEFEAVVAPRAIDEVPSPSEPDALEGG